MQWLDVAQADEIAHRVDTYWRPYHDALGEELARLRAQHGHALLWDGHSIESSLPWLFEGRLPDLNLGTADGQSCAPHLRERLMQVLAGQSEFSHVTDGRFKGGYITRRYGRPAEGVHAAQMEMCFSTYMRQERAPWLLDEERVAGRLQPLLQVYDLESRLWNTVDQHTGANGWPEDTMLWSIGPKPVLAIDRNPRGILEFSVTRSLADSLATAKKRLEVRDRALGEVGEVAAVDDVLALGRHLERVAVAILAQVPRLLEEADVLGERDRDRALAHPADVVEAVLTPVARLGHHVGEDEASFLAQHFFGDLGAAFHRRDCRQPRATGSNPRWAFGDQAVFFGADFF